MPDHARTVSLPRHLRSRGACAAEAENRATTGRLCGVSLPGFVRAGHAQRIRGLNLICGGVGGSCIFFLDFDDVHKIV